MNRKECLYGEVVGAGASPAHGSKKQGSALILTVLMLGLMLTLVLYYVSLIQIETQVSGFTSSLSLSRSGLDQAIAEALTDLEGRHRLRAEEGHVSLAATTTPELVSTGSGGLLTGSVSLGELERLAWPVPAEMLNLISNASWVVSGETNGIHNVYAWAVVPLTGMLDPQGLEGWNAEHLGFFDTIPNEQVYFSATEFMESHDGAAPYFLPGSYSRDRGWYDFTALSWQTNVTLGASTLEMDPLRWSDADARAVFQALYPDRDFAGIHQAFLDFREGKTLPADPDGITAVPVPMFNEVNASLRVENLGEDVVELTHTLNLEMWYPYPGNLNSNVYRVAVTPALESSASDLGIAPAASEDEWTFTPPGGEPETAFVLLTLTTAPMRVTRTVGEVVEVDWRLAGLELEEVDIGIADRLPAGLKLELPSVTVPASGGVVSIEATIEVKDPGLNHNLDMWMEVSEPSLLEINQEAIKAQESEIKSDGWVRWTPEGRAGEWEEGWIGFLPLDTPWRSVDLFAEEGQWWLRHTRPPNWEPGIWRRDRVNPNSGYTEPLQAVFVGLPKERWPGEPDAEKVLLAESRFIADELVAKMLLDEAADQRGSWTGELDERFAVEGWERHMAESVMRNSLNRMALDYQVYGLFIWSEARFPSGQIRSRQREVLVLWVDPYPNPEGRHAVKKLFRSRYQ